MSARLSKLFAELRARKEGAFMPYLVVGDPDLPTSMALASSMIEAGADILELGIAFSDPPADGPALQAASKRALAAGVRTEHALEAIRAIHERHRVPIALLLYYNLVMQHGVERFYARAKAAGVDAILIADLPIEEAGEVLAIAAKHDIAQIFIVSELTTPARLEKIAALAKGYVYLVARLGVTGVQSEVGANMSEVIARVRTKISLPILAGFGLSTPLHARAVLAAGADGAIAGSVFAKLIEAQLRDRPAMKAEVEALACELKRATRRNESC
jgi:tryptophan synthase alpha chain